jgi:heme exporter protein B
MDLTIFREVQVLLKKEWRSQFRQKDHFAALVIYLLSTVFICYLSFEKINDAQTWGALLWISGLFTAFNAMHKALDSAHQPQILHLYTLAKPGAVILSKCIYHAVQIALLNVFSLLLFLLFFGDAVLLKLDWSQLIIGLTLGSTGLGITLTFVASLAQRTGNGIGLMAILGFPLIVPLLVTIVKFTRLAIEGVTWATNAYQLLLLIVLNVLAVVLSYLLFPYLWRE